MPAWYHYRFPTQGDTYCFTIESRNLRPNDGQPRSQGPLLLGPSRRGPWERGWTMATCQRNISQHCWAQHVACVWPPCCDVLRHVGCCWLKFDHFQTWANNTQRVATHRNTVAKRTQHVAPNNVAVCCVGMLRKKKLNNLTIILQHYHFFHCANLIWSNQKHSRMTIPNYKLLFLVVRTLFLLSFRFLT